MRAKIASLNYRALPSPIPAQYLGGFKARGGVEG